jgi:hypothetical protein
MALTGIKCESTNYAGCRRRKKPESRIRKGYRALCTLGKQMGYVMLKDDNTHSTTVFRQLLRPADHQHCQ